MLFDQFSNTLEGGILNTAPKSNAAQRMNSEEKIMRALNSGEKFTIGQAVVAINNNLDSGEFPLAEITVRRSMKSLETKGMVRKYGRDGNAFLYGKIGAEGQQINEIKIPFGEELVTVEEFYRMIVPEDSNPFRRAGNKQVFSVEFEHQVRRMMAFVILTAGEAGMKDKLRKVMTNLVTLHQEIDFVTKLLNSFVNSAVWYDQYRDHIAFENRRVQENDAELFQLALDFVRS